MSTDGGWQNEEIRGRVRGLLIIVAYQLPSRTVEIIDELIEHSESGVAVQILSEMLVESSARISPEYLNLVSQLVARMNLDDIIVERLRPLVHV